MTPASPTLEPLQAAELRIDPSIDGDRVRLVWTGRSAARDPRTILAPYFERVFEVARARGASIEMAFDALAYFNSSTIAALIDAVRLARQWDIQTVFIYKQSLRWQRMSFDALRMFERDHPVQLSAI